MKNVMRALFSPVLFATYLIGALCISMATFAGAPMMAPNPMMAPGAVPSEEELVALEQYYQKLFEETYKNLSPDEKKEVDEYMDKLSQMSDEELLQEYSQYVDEEVKRYNETIDQQKNQPPAPEPSPAAPTPTPEPTPMPVVTPCKETDNILNLINTLIQHTNSFLLKASIIPDFPSLVQKYGKQKSARDAHKNITWPKLKTTIESFVKKLYALKEKDPKSKQYRYINAFGDNSSLCNNLNRLRTLLITYEEKIEAPKFGLGEVSVSSKRAINELLNGYIDTLYATDISNALDQVIKSYEPRAKTLRDQEEEARKKANEESKKYPAGKQTVIVPGRESGRYSPVSVPEVGGHGGDYDGGYNPYYEPTHYNNYEPSTPSEGPSGKISTSNKGGKKGKPTDMPEDGPGKTKGGAQTPQKAPEALLRDVEENVERASKTIKNSLLNDIYSHVQSSAPKNDDLANIQLPDAIKRIKKAIEAVKAVKRRMQTMPPKGKKELEHELKAIITPHRAIFESLIDQVNQIKEDKTIPAIQRVTYQEDLEKLAKEIQKLKQEIGLPQAQPKDAALPGAQAPQMPDLDFERKRADMERMKKEHEAQNAAQKAQEAVVQEVQEKKAANDGEAKEKQNDDAETKKAAQQPVAPAEEKGKDADAEAKKKDVKTDNAAGEQYKPVDYERDIE